MLLVEKTCDRFDQCSVFGGKIRPVRERATGCLEAGQARLLDEQSQFGDQIVEFDRPHRSNRWCRSSYSLTMSAS